MDLVARRVIEKRIIIAAAECLVAAGCSVSVFKGEKVFLTDSTDPVAIDAALHASGEPGFQVKRVIEGVLQEGWVDFVGERIEMITADTTLNLQSALQPANVLALKLNAQQVDGRGSEVDLRNLDIESQDIARAIRQLRKHGFRIARTESDPLNQQKLYEDATAVGCAMLGMVPSEFNRGQLQVQRIVLAIEDNLSDPGMVTKDHVNLASPVNRVK
ncbi:hypothetical protein [Pseudomonas kitaguniensis]|uniref:hypothetical protein n=1 Tax=Pseudomonas kitaguniensis TaxID=2607908 RepID=UPI003BA1F60F